MSDRTPLTGFRLLSFVRKVSIFRNFHLGVGLLCLYYKGSHTHILIHILIWGEEGEKRLSLGVGVSALSDFEPL